MPPKTHRVWFAGLDLVPIPLTIAEGASDEAIFAAAGVPSSPFIQMVRPYRLHHPTPDTYELVIGPEGFGAVLLEALRWLARVTAAGIIGAVTKEQVNAFVQDYLQVEKPEWRFEELTEHAMRFIDDRYHRAAREATYRQALENHRHEPLLAALIADMRDWTSRHS